MNGVNGFPLCAGRLNFFVNISSKMNELGMCPQNKANIREHFTNKHHIRTAKVKFSRHGISIPLRSSCILGQKSKLGDAKFIEPHSNSSF